MKISTKTWWYKMYKFNYKLIEHPIPFQDDLCHFMRVILIYLPLKLFLIIFIPLSVIVGIFHFLSYLYMEVPSVYWALIGFIVIWAIGVYLAEFLCRKIEKKKEPSLVLEWIKAKKRRICPLIEFPDE